MAGVASQQSAAEQDRSVLDDPAGARVPRDLLRGAVLSRWPETSLSSIGGSVYLPTLTFDWDFGNYADAFSHYQDQIIRSFTYALAATVLCLLLAFPLAYVIAFKAGRYKNLILGLVILPFFVTFLIRTIAWKTILADDGWVVSALGSVGLLPSEGRLLSTSWAVIGGLTYNWIIFMILPLYVSLEKIDPRLHRGVERPLLVEQRAVSPR